MNYIAAFVAAVVAPVVAAVVATVVTPQTVSCRQTQELACQLWYKIEDTVLAS